MAGLTIQEMRLHPIAAKAAELILKEHPEAEFSDGLRDLETQARRMANNAIIYGSDWLIRTYANKPMARMLMTYMAENPEECMRANVPQLAGSFHSLLKEHYGEYFARMPHVVGRAFDIRYPRLKNRMFDVPAAERIVKTINRLPEHGVPLELVLDKEGDLQVIHAQFKLPEGSVQI